MKKLFLYIFLILWCCNFANNANAVVKKHAGTGELHLSEKIIDEYFNYITRPLNELPLVFFISEDKKDFHSVIINNDGGGFAELSTIMKKKLKCELKLKKKCHLFSNTRYIVWDNGINPLDGKVSIINREISKEDFILKLTKLGFIINEQQQLIKKKKKAAKAKKIAKELAKQKEAEEKKDKISSLVIPKTDLEVAQSFLNNLQSFIKLYPDELDIIKVSEFFILTRPILDGDLNFKLKEDLELFKEFANTSSKFVKYYDEIIKNKKEKELSKINEAFSNLDKNIKLIKKFLVTNPNSIHMEEWLDSVKGAEIIINDPPSYNQLLITNDNLEKIIKLQIETDKIIADLNNNIDELKKILAKNLTTDLAPLLIEQIKLLESSIKKQNLKDMQLSNKKFEEFMYKKFKEPKLEVEKNKKVVKKKSTKKKQAVKKKPAKTDLKGALSILGLSAAMSMEANVAEAESRGYDCNSLMDMYVCKGKGIIEITPEGTITFNCATYDGCVYDIYEASSFLQKYFLEKKIKIKINKGETIGTLAPMPALCGVGKAKDKICVVKRRPLLTDPKIKGPDIHLIKHKLGASGMTLD